MDNLSKYVNNINGLSKVLSDGNSDFRIVEKKSVFLPFDLPIGKLVVVKYQVYSEVSDIETKIFIDKNLVHQDFFHKATFIDKRFSFYSKGKFDLRIDYTCIQEECIDSHIRQYDSQIDILNYPDEYRIIGLNANLYEYNSQKFPLKVHGMADLVFGDGKFYRELNSKNVSVDVGKDTRPLHLVLTVSGNSGFSVNIYNSQRSLGRISGDQANSAHGVFDLAGVKKGSKIILKFTCSDGNYKCVRIEQMGIAISRKIPTNQETIAIYSVISLILFSFFLSAIVRLNPQKIQNSSP